MNDHDRTPEWLTEMTSFKQNVGPSIAIHIMLVMLIKLNNQKNSELCARARVYVSKC